MKKTMLAVAVMTSMTSAALAQQAVPQQKPDFDFMQHAIQALQQQRNNAFDGQAAAEAKVAGLTDELTKARARIKELEDKLNPPKDKK